MSDLSPSLHGIAGRYASALFELADEANSLDQVADDLDTLKGMLADSADLARAVRSPLFRREEQMRALTAVARRADLSALVVSFLGTLALNRRLFVLPDAVRAFRALLDLRRGTRRVEIRSARPLEWKQESDLRAALAESLGSEVEWETVVDPDLIGGISVQVGSRLVDASLRSRLDRMRAAMRGDNPK